jgi:hypothetical protein
VIDADNYRIGKREKIMLCLYDTFNNKIVSRHRTVEAAQKANDKLQNSLRGNSYLPTQIRKIINGEAVWIDTKQQDAEDDYRNYGIDADDDAIIDAVLEADLCSPEQVCDVVLAVANAGGDWRAELDKAIANDSVEAE